MSRWSGRVTAAPSALWFEEVLGPQFAHDVREVLPAYVAIEKVLLLEYRRLGVVDATAVAALAARLHTLDPAALTADPAANLSDLSFAIEQYALGGLADPPGAWRVDRSRNDAQACAQLMAGRTHLRTVGAELVDLGRAALAAAESTVELPMPGQTHLQAAQVVSPAFQLAALVEEVRHAGGRLLATYDGADRCPLGAGAMAGQELAWDRERMAHLLGFAGPVPHALVAVASRGWAVDVAYDLSGLGVALSRVCTDLMAWGSSAYGFLDLPDEFAGISSAMPQKRNFPILERIRGRTAHLTGLANDLALAQRNTPYTNLVEVSKEAGAHLSTLVGAARSVLRLLTAVLTHARFDAAAMRSACERDYLGGFSLANALTLRHGVPWRTAQVLAGRYITAALARGAGPTEPLGELLGEIVTAAGYAVADPAGLLREAFDVDRALAGRATSGSAAPAAVRTLLAEQSVALDTLAAGWDERAATVRAAARQVDEELGL